MILEIIPPNNWPTFLDYFSQLHNELICSIDIMDGPRELNAGENLKFSNIKFSDGGKGDLGIVAFNGVTEINHVVRHIKQICVTRNSDQNSSSILIESGPSLITTVKFENSNDE